MKIRSLFGVFCILLLGMIPTEVLNSEKRPRPDETENSAPTAKRPKKNESYRVIFKDGSDKIISKNEFDTLKLSRVVQNQLDLESNANTIMLGISANDYKILMLYLHGLLTNTGKSLNKQGMNPLIHILSLADFLDIPTLYNETIHLIALKQANDFQGANQKFVDNPILYMQQFDVLPEHVKHAIAKQLAQTLNTRIGIPYNETLPDLDLAQLVLISAVKQHQFGIPGAKPISSTNKPLMEIYDSLPESPLKAWVLSLITDQYQWVDYSDQFNKNI